jgi:hypothetical protein
MALVVRELPEVRLSATGDVQYGHRKICHVAHVLAVAIGYIL